MYVICMVGPGWAAVIEYISVLTRSTIFVCMYVCMRILTRKGYNKPFYLEIGKEMGSSAMRSRSFLSAMENVVLRRFHYFKCYKNKHMHTYIHTNIFTTVFIHAKTLFVVVIFAHTYPYTYINIFIHTYIHTYIHTHTYIQPCIVVRFFEKERRCGRANKGHDRAPLRAIALPYIHTY